jgi:predicted HicB family RNase H-like nuclease
MKKAAVKKNSETKILTGFRIHPKIKALAVEAAIQENRSFSNYLENLIRKDIESKSLIPKRSKTTFS